MFLHRLSIMKSGSEMIQISAYTGGGKGQRQVPPSSISIWTPDEKPRDDGKVYWNPRRELTHEEIDELKVFLCNELDRLKKSTLF